MNWICPNCHKPLLKESNSLLCETGHCFDCAREGYVNLLPASHKRSKDPGDNREMIDARHRVHQARLYHPLAEKIGTIMKALIGQNALVLDLGCGEGYYSSVLHQVAGKLRVHGVDVSKPAIRIAARSCPNAHFAVASSFDVPLASRSVDAAFSVFAPTGAAELARLVRPGGYFLDVSPASSHLWELRELLYDNPRAHEQVVRELPSFEQASSEAVEFILELTAEQLRDLVAMTPYAYGGQRENKGQLARLDRLKLQVAFSLNLYRRLPS